MANISSANGSIKFSEAWDPIYVEKMIKLFKKNFSDYYGFAQ